MKKGAVWLATALVATSLVAAGCGDDEESDGGGGGASTEESGGEAGKVAVLLPDSKSSVRWETVDRPLAAGGVRRGRRRGDHLERRGRQGDAAAAGRAGDHQRREGAAAGEPRLRLGRGDRGERQGPGREGDRLRPPHAQHRRDRLLRLVQQREGRPAPGSRASSTAWATSRARRSPCSTARRPTTTRRCSRRATTRSSTRSSTRASGRRSTTSPCPTGTTRRR